MKFKDRFHERHLFRVTHHVILNVILWEVYELSGGNKVYRWPRGRRGYLLTFSQPKDLHDPNQSITATLAYIEKGGFGVQLPHPINPRNILCIVCIMHETAARLKFSAGKR